MRLRDAVQWMIIVKPLWHFYVFILSYVTFLNVVAWPFKTIQNETAIVSRHVDILSSFVFSTFDNYGRINLHSRCFRGNLPHNSGKFLVQLQIVSYIVSQPNNDSHLVIVGLCLYEDEESLWESTSSLTTCPFFTYFGDFTHLSWACFLCYWAEILICWCQSLQE